MPLSVPSAAATIIATGGFEAHTTLDIIFGSGDVVHLSTVNIDDVDTIAFGTVDYTNGLRVAGSLDQSLTVSVDRVDLSVQNVDLVLGSTVVNNVKSLNGAKGILSVVYVSGATKSQAVVLEGQLSNASNESPEVKFQLISYLCLSGPVGGWRPLMLHCALRYKRAGCDSTDSTPTCSHLFDDLNGCSNKAPAARLTTPTPSNNQGSFQGFVFRSPIIVGSGITDPQGAIDGGNDFSTYDRQSTWDGRHTLPSEYYGI